MKTAFVTAAAATEQNKTFIFIELAGIAVVYQNQNGLVNER